MSRRSWLSDTGIRPVLVLYDKQYEVYVYCIAHTEKMCIQVCIQWLENIIKRTIGEGKQQKIDNQNQWLWWSRLNVFLFFAFRLMVHFHFLISDTARELCNRSEWMKTVFIKLYSLGCYQTCYTAQVLIANLTLTCPGRDSNAPLVS